MTSALSERGLVLAPRGRDAMLAASMLAEAGIACTVCDTLAALIAAMTAGAAFAIVTEEAVRAVDLAPLHGYLAAQPPWSDFPFILLTERGVGSNRNPATRRYVDILGNVTIIERPFHPMTLVTLATSAARARRRQYEALSRIQALDDSERQFRTLADSIPTLCWMADADGSIFWYNQQWYDYTGMVPAQMTGWGWQAVHDPACLPDVLVRWRASIATGNEFDMTFPLRSRDGNFEPFLTRIRPLRDAGGAVVRWFGTNTNIAAQYAAEAALRDLAVTLEARVAERTAAHEQAREQLHQAQKLETIGQLTGGVAHDFNNLLTPITGALDILQRKIGDGDARSARLIDGAMQSAERARVLVQRLLGFARKQVLEARAVNLSELVAGMSDLIRSSVGPSIELVVSCDERLPLALADPNQLELAVLNLCVNSRDAMPNGGRLTIATAVVELAGGAGPALPSGTYLKLSVSDTGLGMDAATLARAVEPFYSTKEQGRGTGLGLSMVHGLAAQLGGAFQLSSTVEAGTTACLYLTVAAPETAGISARPSSAAVTGSASLDILLVDDEDVVRGATTAMLRDLGHRVVEATGGADALERLQGGFVPDVVITDYKMPRMSGAQLAERMKAVWPRLPVLLVTGYIGDDWAAPDVPVLAKPFRSADLAAAVMHVVRQ